MSGREGGKRGRLSLRAESVGADVEGGPGGRGNDGAEVADGFGADQRGEFAAFRKRIIAEETVEKTGGPGVAGAVGVDDIGNDDGRDLVKFVAAGEPGAVFAHFDGGENTGGGEALGEFGVVGVAILIERADLVFVGEDDIDALVELGENPIARGVDDFERGEVHANSAAGGAGAGEHAVDEGLVEDEVSLDVRVAEAGEIVGRDFVGRKRHRGAEARAHGALSVGRDKDERAGVGEIGAFEARRVDAGGGEGTAIGVSEGIVAQFAEKGGAKAETSGVERGVGSGAAGGRGGGDFEM